MKLFLELIEVLPGEDQSSADFIRVDVTDFSQQDYDDTLANMRVQATNYGNSILQKHACHHDETKSCTVGAV